MGRVPNDELRTKIIKHLADQYQILETREPNHLSTYVYCRTKAFLDQKEATRPTEQEVMLFAIGYGLQDVLTPKDAEAPLYESEGIIYRPDMVFIDNNIHNLAELKTTRRSAKRHNDDIPETWRDYMLGGCFLRDSNEYDLIVLYLMGGYSPPFPELYCDHYTFTDDEISDNWGMIMENKATLDEAFKEDTPPIPFENCYDWECKYCRYRMVCETLVGME